MLILTRRVNEVIRIGDDIEVLVMNVKGNQVRIGIKAPRTTVVDRQEVAERKAVEGELRDLLHVDPAVRLPAGQVRTLRPGIDYDPDAVCPGCGCFRDRCACDLREGANNGLREPSSIPATPGVAKIAGRGRINIARAFEKLKAAENPAADLKKN